jgi:hypothetical protein
MLTVMMSFVEFVVKQCCGTSLVRIRNALDGVLGKDQVHITMVNSPEDVKPGQRNVNKWLQTDC